MGWGLACSRMDIAHQLHWINAPLSLFSPTEVRLASANGNSLVTQLGHSQGSSSLSPSLTHSSVETLPHFAWVQFAQIEHCIPRWLHLTGFWHTVQGNLTGPGFRASSRRAVCEAGSGRILGKGVELFSTEKRRRALDTQQTRHHGAYIQDISHSFIFLFFLWEQIRAMHWSYRKIAIL